ncbi:MAG: 2-oxoglutarate dehydrogenase complex dihydrolipoyllysine-residue succinyltransferase [Alphaproteobacteria bacterium]|nr:2-oxoglutarate dehydrogenase complex dihydrolipoyllysine-residue succinyltransferase [Alphaproteobacteria bacterium]MBU1560645.1 2-oxoglutarate dehydrogenase complex dihydrolipoyllysine-residue succinyltransferase [Alphaproteobacteria bacterium]MBU2301971.1 2-oxoglutarate dehydrogenase complex dihydrolipoyllysine-residue succinyltransferase [Alphaproteobacteria bacterium]
MSTEIRVPTLGESVTEATIGQWFKKVGDTVSADEPIVELETDKVTIEVPAPAAGVLEAISAQPGETVDVGALLGAIGGAGAAAAAKPAEVKEDVPAANAAGPEPVKPEAAPAAAATSMAPAPSAQKLINESGLAASEIDGSGKRGQVLKEDVLSAMAKPAPALAQAAPAAAPAAKPAEAPKAPAAPRAPVSADDASREERVKMTRLRQTIARRLKDAQNTAAMLTTFNEVDMAPVMELRTQYKELFEKKHGVKLGFMGFFTKAVVHALKEIPSINAEIDGDDLVYKQYAHIGVAVGTDKGLVVPVIRNADQMSIAEIEKGINAMGKKARDGQLSMADMQGGTFTISNGGVYGSLMSTPILNAPQSGILGMHKIQERPVVVGGQIVIRPMMYLALSYDHRIVDGKEAVTFLVRVKESLEAPERLVLDL